MPELTLYQFTLSPYCIKVRRILEHKRLAYKTVEVNPFARGDVVRISGQKRLPVLVDGDRKGNGPRESVVADSTRIAQYLDVQYPDHPVYPADAGACARVLALEDWSDELFAGNLIPLKIFSPGNAAKMVEQSKPFYEPRWYYELLYPAGPVLLRSLTRRLRRGRSLDEMRRDYERDLDLLESMAARRVDLCSERPTAFDFAVWGLLRTMEGLDGEELLGTRPHLLSWYGALKRL